MTCQIHVYLHPDMYNVVVRDNTIVRVTKYIGDIQMPREVEFVELPRDVQDAIFIKLLETQDNA